jgi:hypothetical protein
MNKLLLFARTVMILGLLSAVVPAIAADDKVDVNGTWDVEIEIAGQQGRPTFTFKQEGDKLSGMYKGQFGEAPVTGTLDGKKIEFKFETQGVQIVYTGEVDKDTMKGKADYAGQASGEWKAKKREAK